MLTSRFKLFVMRMHLAVGLIGCAISLPAQLGAMSNTSPGAYLEGQTSQIKKTLGGNLVIVEVLEGFLPVSDHGEPVIGPNPCASQLKAYLPPAYTRLVLLDSQGAKMEVQTRASALVLDLSQLPPGRYSLQFSGPEVAATAQTFWRQ